MNRMSKAGWIAVAVVALGVAGIFLLTPPPDNGPSTSDDAVAASGADTVAVNDPAHDRPFDVSVWTPSAADANGSLIVISHGFSGDRTSYSALAKPLTEEGYTVVAPTHPDLAGLQSNDPALDPLTLRPRHLSLTVDAMESTAGGPFDSVSVIGHSLGGYSALRLAGADPKLDGTLESHCAEVDDQVLCSDRATSRFATVAAAGDNFADPRIDHVVLLAPGYGPFFGEEPLGIDAEAMVISAEGDVELPGAQVEDLIDRLGPNTKTLSTKGGHYVFLRPCSSAEAADFPEICEDPEGVDRSEIHAELSTQIVTFLKS